MTDESPPTVLTIEDLDTFLKKFEGDLEKPTPMTHCMSCSIELPTALTDYYTGQCHACFHARVPWCFSAPVSDAYFVVMNGD